MSLLKRFINSILTLIGAVLQPFKDVAEVRELFLRQLHEQSKLAHPNPINHFGQKCFSQSDEDGITLEILRRLKCLEHGTFAEFGVGDGTENNTLILKALGWKGFWVGGESLAFESKQQRSEFNYLQTWITLENIVALMHQGKKDIEAMTVDVVSLDLDGNDIYFVQKLLAAENKPKLFIVEYNAKFIPPVKWQISYEAKHSWTEDDYYGASLASFAELFESHSYILVCCNSATGSNAFFVRSEFANSFIDVPRDIGALFVPPRFSVYRHYGHKPSLRTIERLFEV